jgi:hypothetical protein
MSPNLLSDVSEAQKSLIIVRDKFPLFRSGWVGDGRWESPGGLRFTTSTPQEYAGPAPDHGNVLGRIMAVFAAMAVLVPELFTLPYRSRVTTAADVV